MSPLGKQSIQKDATDLRVLLNMTGGSTGSFEFRYRLGAVTGIGATSASLNIPYLSAVAYQTYMIVDPFTVECECRLIKSISGLTYGFDALTYAHAQNDLVWFTELPYLSIMWFGAKADGGTFDNYLPISRALLNAGAADRLSVVWAPSGIYGIKSMPYVPNGVSFQGEGINPALPGTVIKAISGWSGTKLIQLGTSGITNASSWIKDMRLNCNQLVNVGVYSDALDEPSGLERIAVVDAVTHGIHIDGSSTAAVRNYTLRDIVVTFPNAAGTEVGVEIHGGDKVTRGIDGLTVTATGTNIPAGLRLKQVKGGLFSRMHMERCNDAVDLGGATPDWVKNIVIAGIVGNNNVTNLVHIRNAADTDGIVIEGFDPHNPAGTNLILDDKNSITIPGTGAPIAQYTIGRIFQLKGSRQHSYSEKAIFRKNLVDAPTATPVFRIETTNESGSNDSGAYTAIVKAIVSQPQAAGVGSPVASKGYMGMFCRSINQAGAGANSTVTDIALTASAATAPATRDIGAVTMSLVETTEYQIDVQFTVDVTGSSPADPEITLEVELIWENFLTPPLMSQL